MHTVRSSIVYNYLLSPFTMYIITIIIVVVVVVVVVE